MPIQPFIRQASYRQRLLPGLTLLWALALTLGLIQPAQAQSTPAGAGVAWGRNISGQLNIPTNLGDVTAIAAGANHALALKRDGTVAGWGRNDYGQATPPAGLSGVTAIAAGLIHSLALKHDGTVVAWGDNGMGQTTVPAGLSGITAIAAGASHSLALKADGTVVAWGCGYYDNGQCTIPTGLQNVTAIAAGGDRSLALKADGTVVGWGNYVASELAILAGLRGITAITVARVHGLALKNDGTVVVWGRNDYGQATVPAGLSGVVAISSAGGHNLALKSNGTVVAWGCGSFYAYGQCTVPTSLNNVIAIAAGDDFSLAITTSNDVTPPTAHPTLSPAANAAGWNNTNVTVNWNWTDSGSGIDPGSCETSSTSNIGVGTQTLTAYCSDQVGNLTSASYTVKVDRATPQIRATVSPQSSGGGWYNQAVTVSFTCEDQGSGLATNTVGGNLTMSSEGNYPAVTNTGACIDNAGNVATAVTVGPFKLDLTKPTISAAATTQPNANGWYKDNVTVHFTCADALSGIGICPDDQLLSTEGSAVSSTSQTVRDRVLNSSDPSNVVTVKLDKTAPSVLLTGVTNGATYLFGSVPTAACSTTDALSGVATQATLSVTGGNPDGSGNFTATCNGATDLASNSAAPVSVSYTVNAPLLPEIAVTGNGQPLTSGSTTPSSSNGTNLGSTLPGSAVTQTFTIVNSGTGVLNLSGAPRVGLSGANAADFSVVTLPAATVATGSSTTFQIRFSPSAAGVRTATVTIANNDSDENPYTFAIQGAGLQSLQPTTQLTQLPGYTQSCTAASAPYVKRCTLSFTLKNTSSGPLQIRYEQLTKLSTHVYVLNGTPNPGQVGTVVSDGRTLAVNATFPPTFQLGLTSNTAYSLFFKVYGYPGATVAAGADEAQAVELGEFEVTLNPDETSTMTTVFLPLVNR